MSPAVVILSIGAAWMWSLGVLVVLLAYRDEMTIWSRTALAVLWPISMPAYTLVQAIERLRHPLRSASMPDAWS